jgi:hypothetical protein
LEYLPSFGVLAVFRLHRRQNCEILQLSHSEHSGRALRRVPPSLTSIGIKTGQGLKVLFFSFNIIIARERAVSQGICAKPNRHKLDDRYRG